jgi:hypothetical protein
MPRTSILVYRSEGSDGYTAGTWGVIVSECGDSWCDGGNPSKEMALRAGRRLARSALGYTVRIAAQIPVTVVGDSELLAKFAQKIR